MPRLAELWARWHLNDMRAGCEHQRADAAYTAPATLTLTPLTWGPKYHALREQALNGTMAPMDAERWPATVKAIHLLTLGLDSPKHPKKWGHAGDAMLLEGLVKVEKTETKLATWVTRDEHPEGLMSVPCATCGYKYGSQWLHEDVPEDVLRELFEMGPDVTVELWRK